MLMPKRVKHRKQFRGTMRGKANRGNKISYGEYGIVAAEPCWIKSNQIEAARVAMTRSIKRDKNILIYLHQQAITVILLTNEHYYYILIHYILYMHNI